MSRYRDWAIDQRLSLPPPPVSGWSSLLCTAHNLLELAKSA